MYSDIPEQGKISVIESHTELDKSIVMKNYMRAVRLKIENINLRGWLLDVLNCVNSIAGEIFSLDDVYIFAERLARKHPENHNVLAKIRQQMQYLRDKGFIEFLGGGMYRKTRNI